MSNYYHNKYFSSTIFNYDYEPIAKAVQEEYQPKTIIEFGCGNGELSKAFSREGVVVTAIDGYSTPDFKEFDTIRFYKVDLNNPEEIKLFLTSVDIKFDVAICMEVAEHLNPDVSKELINSLTTVSDTVVFSAAIPGQSGDGHINCRSREFWHELFEQKEFIVCDTLRQRIKDNDKVGKWYQLNTVDYVKFSDQHKLRYNEIIKRLVTSESEAASNYYKTEKKLQLLRSIFNFSLIKGAFHFRNLIKKLSGKKPVAVP